MGIRKSNSRPSSAVVVSSSASSIAKSEEDIIRNNCAMVSNPPPTKNAICVLFDIDGTLANSWKLGYDATVVVLETNQDKCKEVITMNEKFYHETCVYATPERLARSAGYLPEDPEFGAVGADLGKQFDDNYVQLVSLQTAQFYDGILEILQKIPANVKLGALTNACADYGHRVIQVNCPTDNTKKDTTQFSLYDRFDVIHGADTVPKPKPHPDGLLQCIQEIGLLDEKEKESLRNCIYVGDAIGDGRAARAAGMISIGVTWGSNSKEKLKNADTFDYLCDTVEELKALLPQDP